MANYFYLTLDTTAPSSPTLNIAGGAVYTNTQLVNLELGTGDTNMEGYQMKIWGDVDGTYDTGIQATESESTWISFTGIKQIKLALGDGTKTINFRLRDEVYNESSSVSDTVTLDMALPEVNVGSVDRSKISKITGKNIASFTFSSVEEFAEYKVKVVTSTSAGHTTGTLIGTTNGSVNTAGTGSFTTPVTVEIAGSDLELASSGDGQKIVKVFVKNQAGTWSV
jgi:hypothetical protein